jgi:hypothetical protein
LNALWIDPSVLLAAAISVCFAASAILAEHTSQQ